MGYVQTTAINDQAQDQAGFCLRFAQKVFNTKPYGYPSAWIAWEATAVKHYDRNFPGDVVAPVWFSHIGNYDGTGNKNWGHVVAHFPGRGYLSSPGNGYGQQWFGSIEEIEFACANIIRNGLDALRYSRPTLTMVNTKYGWNITRFATFQKI